MEEAILLDKLLRKREVLEKIKETSFKYTLLIKKIPIKKASQKEMEYLVRKFDELINDVKNLFNSNQYENQNSKN